MDKKKHHYLPKHYLKGFAEAPIFDKIWVYEKGKQKTFCTNLLNAGMENHYYTDITPEGVKDTNTCENWLAEEIESPAVPVIDKIRKKNILTDEEKAIMAIYMSVMLRRVPKHRKRVDAVLPEVLAEKIEEIKMGLIPELSSEWQGETALESLKKYVEDTPKKLYLPTYSPELAKIIYTMNWRFLTFEGHRGFMANDNPFTFDEGSDQESNPIGITFPISTNIALWATWDNVVDKAYVTTEQNIVDFVNWRTLKVATKYLFYPTQENWVIKRVNSEQKDLEF